MLSSLRAVTRHSRSFSKSIYPTSSLLTRSFHSPFVALDTSSQTSPLTSPPAPGSHIQVLYEKQADHSPEVQLSHSGTRTYVVSEPDPANTPYEVPSGAYPTSAPYVNFTSTEAPLSLDSSASASQAHPTLTRSVPNNESGIGESAAVRHADAPGEMGGRGGSHGGLGLMDRSSTKQSGVELADRNPAPDSDVAEKWSKLGLGKAWQERK